MTRDAQRKLLYLGFAFPPGVQALYPGMNVAGHQFEMSLLREVRKYFLVRSVATLPFVPPRIEKAEPDSGLDHECLLLEKPPEVLHRFNSLIQLKRAYQNWATEGWVPEVVLVYNLSPVYSVFLRWLRRRPACPKLVLLLLDSPSLGQSVPWLRRFRRALKPMFIPDAEMVDCFDGCIGLSRTTERFFSAKHVPFLWMPGGCKEKLVLPETGNVLDKRGKEICFGYFGNLGSHAGALQLAKVFLAANVPATLEICGHGKNDEEYRQIAARNPGVVFHGWVETERLTAFGCRCDVLVNPRPATHGNSNNFASKLFDYALCGSAILTSRLSGEEEVLGPDAYYFDAGAYETSLAAQLRALASTPRDELARRGEAVKQKVLREFAWSDQGERIAHFLGSLLPKEKLEGTTVPLTD